MKKWRCTICNYIHEGETPPDECPVCGAGPEAFELVEDGAAVEAPANAPAEKPAATPVGKADAPKGQAKTAVFKLTYGLFIVTSVKDGKPNGQACNTVFQVTSDPVQVAIGINKNNLTHEYITDSGIIGVSIIGQDGHDLVRRFGYRSGRELDKFAGIKHSLGVTGAPLVDGAIAYLECRLNRERSVDVGTHTLFVAEVVDGEMREDREPMTYAYFRQTK
ncbi:MAG: flavin reductase [Bacillota bacterium]